MNVYTIKDNGADFFMQPYVARSDQEAVRMYVLAMGDRWPFRGDYHLFHVGNFSDETGEIEGIVPRLVIRGDSLDASSDPRVKGN